jgi:type IV secretion system protein VirB10
MENKNLNSSDETTTVDSLDYQDTFAQLNQYQEDKLNDDFNNSSNASDLENQKNSTLKKIQFYVTMIVGVVFLILILFSFLKNILSSEDKEKVVEIEAPKVQKIKADDLFANINEDEKEIKEEVKEKNPFLDDKKEIDIFQAIKVNPPKPQIVKGSSGAILKSNNNSSSSSSSNSSSKYDDDIAQLEAQLDSISNTNNDSKNDSNQDYSGDTFTPSVAKINEFNPDLLLPKGSYIGCSLDTRFVSSIQGSTSCTVSQNIYSSNGNVLLIEKGSKIFGTYKGDNANDGTSRYFVVWQEIRTPNHLRIPVNSGASDELGGAGLEGEIDHKWMMRFGSSILLSAIDDAFNVLAWKLTNKNSGKDGNQIDYTENTRDNAQNISSIALEKFINIKPTVYKQHGDLVGVYVNRDIDFSKVYKISKKE